jgi:hypothetical protein
MSKSNNENCLIRHCFFTVGVYEEGFCVSRGFWPQNMGYGADHCVRDVSRLINRLTFLLIYLPRRPFLAAFRQPYPSRLKSASLILRILKALCLLVPFRVWPQSLHFTRGKPRCADHRSRDNDRSPARHRAARIRTALRNAHHRPGQRFHFWRKN